MDFKPAETLYYLKINDDVKELEITTTQEDINATVEIEGNKKWWKSYKWLIIFAC